MSANAQITVIKTKTTDKAKAKASADRQKERLEKVKSATTEVEMVAAKEVAMRKSAEGKKIASAIEKTKMEMAVTMDLLKKQKVELRNLEDEMADLCRPTPEEFQQLQKKEIERLMEAGDTEGMLELMAKQTAKSAPKSKGGRKTKASNVDKNWSIQDPFRVPTGLEIVWKKGEKKNSETIWNGGGNYKCPYNCNANRTTLSGMKKHYDKCDRRPPSSFNINSDGGTRKSAPYADRNNVLTKAQFKAYCDGLALANGDCSKAIWKYDEDADEDFGEIA
jgi:hypothetical protein